MTTQFWKLDSPQMCRDFLKQLRFGPEGNEITELTMADGRVVTIEEAPDDLVMRFVGDIAAAMERAQNK